MGECNGSDVTGEGGWPSKRWVAVVLLLALFPAVVSCGFHLRGSQSDQGPGENKLLPHLESVYVEGPIHSDMVISLKESFKLVGTEVAPASGAGVPVVAVLKEGFDSRLLAIGSDGKVVEKELSLVVTFSFTDAQSGNKPQPETIRIVREVLADERQFTAQLEEEITLRREMVFDATRHILRRVRAVSS